MSFFNKLFGPSKAYPPLDQTHPISQDLKKLQQPLDSLAQEVNDQLEVVPSEQTAYVFIGKPPKKFGVAWVRDGKIFNLKNVVEEKKIPPEKLEKVSDKLRKAYVRSKNDSRYSAQLGSQTLVVSASNQLKKEMDDIVQELDS